MQGRLRASESRGVGSSLVLERSCRPHTRLHDHAWQRQGESCGLGPVVAAVCPCGGTHTPDVWLVFLAAS